MKVKAFHLLLAVLFIGKTVQSQDFTSFYPSDTIWKRTVHRIIDLDFPKNRLMSDEAAKSSGYHGLMEIILTGIEEYGIDVYEKIEGGEFINILTLSKIYENLGSTVDTFEVENIETGEYEMQIDKSPVDLASVKRFEIVQEYFFIKSKSLFTSQIIALRPIRVFYKDHNIDNETENEDDPQDEEGVFEDEGEINFADVGWFRFEQLKFLLANETIKNPANQSAYSNYLSKLELGDFDSYIIKVNNNYGKGIADYTDANENPNRPTLEMMLESHRIEYELFNFEMNLWEY